MKNKIQAEKLSNFLKDFNLPENAMLERKALGTEIALQEVEEKTFIAKITTSSVDRDGDIVIPTGADITDFQKNAVLIWDHSYSQPPIGKILNLQITSDAIYAKIKMADTEFGEELWSLIKGGFLKTCSIGFIVKEALLAGTEAFRRYVKENNLNITNTVKRIITKFLLIENSMVSIPANQDALVTAVTNKSIHLSEKLAKELCPIMENPTTETTNLSTYSEDKPVKQKEEPKVEESKIEEPKKVEQQWTVLRTGPYKVTDQDKESAKKLKLGKII